MTEPAPQPSPRRRLRRVLSLVLTVALVGYIVWYVVERRETLAQLWDMGLWDAAAIAGLLLVLRALRAWELQYVVNVLGAPMGLWEAAMLTSGCTLLNYLPLNAGTLVKARALKRRQSLMYAHFVSMLGALILVTSFAAGLLGLVAVLVSPSGGASVRWPLLAFFAAAMAGPLVVIRTPARWLGEGGGFVRTALRDLLQGWQELRSTGRALPVLALVAVLKLLGSAVAYYVCFRALKSDVSLFTCMLFAAVSVVMMIVNVTPGGLGVKELLVGAMGALTGVGFDRGVFASSLGRAFSLAFIVVTGLPSLVYLRRKKLL